MDMNNGKELIPALPAVSLEQGRGLVPQDLAGLDYLAHVFSVSSMMPRGLERKEDIFVVLAMGSEVGLTPMQSVQNISAINGRPVIWGDAMLGLVEASGLLEDFEEKMSGAGKDFMCTAIAKRKGRKTPIERSFSIKMAANAGLTDKGPWKKYAERMCQMRARSWCLRDGFSDVLKGLRTPADTDDVIDVTPTMPDKPEPDAKKMADILGPAEPAAGTVDVEIKGGVIGDDKAVDDLAEKIEEVTDYGIFIEDGDSAAEPEVEPEKSNADYESMFEKELMIHPGKYPMNEWVKDHMKRGGCSDGEIIKFALRNPKGFLIGYDKFIDALNQGPDTEDEPEQDEQPGMTEDEIKFLNEWFRLRSGFEQYVIENLDRFEKTSKMLLTKARQKWAKQVRKPWPEKQVNIEDTEDGAETVKAETGGFTNGHDDIATPDNATDAPEYAELMELKKSNFREYAMVTNGKDPKSVSECVDMIAAIKEAIDK